MNIEKISTPMNIKQNVDTYEYHKKSTAMNIKKNIDTYQGGRSCAGARGAPVEKFGLGRKF